MVRKKPIRKIKRIKRSHPPGTLPGTLVAHFEAGAEPAQILMFSYGPDRCEERTLRPEEIPTLAVPENGVLWLDIWGLSDPGIVKAVGDRFGFHPLALEDVLNVPQRAKVERYPGHLLIILVEADRRDVDRSGHVPTRYPYSALSATASSPSESARSSGSITGIACRPSTFSRTSRSTRP